MELVKDRGMSATKPNLRPVDNSPPHVRAELFVAIARVREAEERLASNKAQIEKLHERTWAAQTAVEDTEGAIEKAKETQIATKTDLAGVRTEIAELRTELNPHSPADA